jgi:hypothetical protein
VALVASTVKMTHPLIGQSSAKIFMGFGSLALTQYKHGEGDYSYIAFCYRPLERKQLGELRHRTESMEIKHNWSRYGL